MTLIELINELDSGTHALPVSTRKLAAQTLRELSQDRDELIAFIRKWLPEKIDEMCAKIRSKS